MGHSIMPDSAASIRLGSFPLILSIRAHKESGRSALLICFTNENSISSSLYEMLDPFRSFVLFPSLPHATRAVGALPEKEEQSHPGTLKEEGKQLNLDSNRARHALALVMGKGFNSAS